MKTIDDIRELLPALEKMMLNAPEIGYYFFGRTEDDYDEVWAENSVCYEENGWCIEVNYRCIGEWKSDRRDNLTNSSASLKKAWGEVTEITIDHLDEEVNLSDEEFNEVMNELELALADI